MTKTDKIFELTAPYDNPYQSIRTKLLFVCSAGMLRSPTGAMVGLQRGYNTRSCGALVDRALIPLSANLIAWAEFIVFVDKDSYSEARQVFGSTAMWDQLQGKSIVLNIYDCYDAFDRQLIAKFNDWFNDWEMESSYKKVTSS